MFHNHTPISVQLKHGTLLIDQEDADLLVYRWCSHSNPISHTKYAIRNRSHRTERIGQESIHRMILTRMIGRPMAKGEMVDHINGDGLDNRRCNLRLCTNSQNQQNRRHCGVKTKSGHRGVTWHERNGMWRVRVYIPDDDGKTREKLVGYFRKLEDAIEARRQATIKYYGEFAPVDQ